VVKVHDGIERIELPREEHLGQLVGHLRRGLHQKLGRPLDFVRLIALPVE